MQKQCAVDGITFEAKRATALYCSERCKKQAQRRPKKPTATVISIGDLANVDLRPDGGDEDEAPAAIPDGPLAKATRKQLEAAGRIDTALGVAALYAAQRLDLVGLVDTGAGFAALLKSHREALAEAVKDAESTADPLDQIRASAALKLVVGGKA